MRILILALVCPAASIAPNEPFVRHLTHDQAVRDARTFINLLEDTHPDPYTAHGGRVEFRRKAQAILRDLPQDGIVAEDLMSRLHPLIVPLPGHTMLPDRRWRDPDAWLPIRFAVVADSIVLAASDLEQLKDLNGYRVLGANGHPLEEFLERNGRELPSENRQGALDVTTRILCSRKFVLGLFPGDNPDAITFQIQSPGGETAERTVSWKDRRLWNPGKCLNPQPRWPELPASEDPFFTKIFDQPKAAYLCVAHIMGREAYELALRSNAAEGREMLESYYERRKEKVPGEVAAALKGVPSFFETGVHLLGEMKRRQVPARIIDLRGNNGGWTPAVYPFLYALYGDAYYLKDFPGQYITRQSALFLKKNDAMVEKWRNEIEDPLFEAGDYRFESSGDSGPRESRRARAVSKYKADGYSSASALENLNGQPLYQPKAVVVLTDAGTYSAAFHFLFYLHHMGAQSVGVPPSQSPNAFMEMTEFTLPESRLQGSIANSLQLYMPENPKADTFPVTHTLIYKVFQRYGFDIETALRYALDLIAAGKL